MQSARTRALSVLTGLLAVLVFGFSSAHAAGETLTIGQMSRTDVVGQWTLNMPNGKKLTSTDVGVDAYMHTIKDAPLGSYKLTLEPPNGAETNTDISNGSTKVSSTQDLVISFTLQAGETLRVIAEYSFQGSIKIISDPSGAPFTISAPNNIVLKGTTPAQFFDLPPFYYTAFFGEKKDCVTPKPQKRELETPGLVVFYGKYNCTTAGAPVQSSFSSSSGTRSSTSTPVKDTVKRIDLQHVVSQLEVLPGNEISVVLRVKNPTKSILRNLNVTEMFDPAQLSFEGTLPRDGTRNPGALHWKIDELTPQETWTVTLTGTTAATLKNGERINLTATVRSTNLARPAGKVAGVDVVTGLPKTGGPVDQLFVIISSISGLALLRRWKRA
ncbi:hypothetical protein A3D88_04000 [Candidatus Peribacteria bacterium RIFCSPHIGHO2_02_FULL_52_16]|nr:MAG: hypothetical protein A2706_05280 [Candidatus Peribacteria bacterium RIFCSPHIGHO2_01_FULL_51_35]OGJ61882.1 MAG: hypothetical protein A3D88_04000 [Candidatus Peribacteria bacterium RIFCSPHIGHO2_02_FULL_52_16]